MELARGCAEQALSFAANSGLRREIDSLLLSLSSFPARALKNRWARPGAGAMSLTLSSPKSLTETAVAYIRQWSAPTETTMPSLAIMARRADFPTPGPAADPDPFQGTVGHQQRLVVPKANHFGNDNAAVTGMNIASIANREIALDASHFDQEALNAADIAEDVKGGQATQLV